jgi:YaiO family outer membrane protein
VWWDLWERAYGNARLEVAPDATGRAELDLHTALYQGVGRGWEAGAAWRRQHFGGDVDVTALTLTAARYLDGAYLRGGVTLSGRDGVEGAAVDGTARWYFHPPEDLVEIGAQWGETPELVGPGPVVGFDEGGHGHARIQLFPWPYVGFGLSAEVRFFRHVPVRHGVSASVHARW